MSDCECSGLGTRLRNLTAGTGGTAGRKVVTFVVLDWVLAGDYYVLDILQSTHLQGVNPMFQTEELIGPKYETLGLDGEELATNGDLRLRVVSVPDGRFDGRVIFL